MCPEKANMEISIVVSLQNIERYHISRDPDKRSIQLLNMENINYLERLREKGK